MNAMFRKATCVVGPSGSRTTRPVKVIRLRLVPARMQFILEVTTLQHKHTINIRNIAAPVGSFRTTEIFKYEWTFHLDVMV